MHKRAVAATAVMGASVLALAACGGSSGGGGGGSSSSPPTGAKLTGACAQYNQYAGPKGTVTMFGSIISPESDSLAKSWAQFEQCTGITINYTGSNTFESDLPVKVNGGNPPDLAIIPQPGLLTQMVLTGAVKKPPAQTVANEANWSQYWKTYGSVRGTFYAAPMSANMKSLVWYSPKYFKATRLPGADHLGGPHVAVRARSPRPAAPSRGAAGSARARRAAGRPRTGSRRSCSVSTAPVSTTNWIRHKVKFNRPQIQAAMTIVHNWMQNPAWVNGGFGDVKTIADHARSRTPASRS